ncbi:hypothetical protein PAMP_013849 [Pampus punctatissimus]
MCILIHSSGVCVNQPLSDSPGGLTCQSNLICQPHCHYVLLEGAADEKKRDGSPSGGPAPHTHSKACWEPVAMTASGQQGESDGEEGGERMQTCGAVKWQFSAGPLFWRRTKQCGGNKDPDTLKTRAHV